MIAVVSLIIALWPSGRFDSKTTKSFSTLDSINRSKTLRIGYEGYPPYVIKDPSSGKLTGYSVELAELMASEAGWKIEWVQTSADTKIPDLEAGRFDLMVEPIFQTIPRATKVTFSTPYSYFGYAAAIVRKGENRFKSVSDLNTKGVVVAVRLGYTDQTYAERNLPNATIRKLKADDISQVFADVTSGHSDIALADLEQVKAYAKEHPNSVDALWVDNPPAAVPAGFMLRQGDFVFFNFLNTAISYLDSNGVFEQLDKKYGVSAKRVGKQWAQ